MPVFSAYARHMRANMPKATAAIPALDQAEEMEKSGTICDRPKFSRGPNKAFSRK
jgi:hypothetical protein